MSLVLESKEILKNKSNHNDEICQRDTGAKPKSKQEAKLEQFEQINK